MIHPEYGGSCSLKRWCLSTKLYGVISQKTVILILYLPLWILEVSKMCNFIIWWNTLQKVPQCKCCMFSTEQTICLMSLITHTGRLWLLDHTQRCTTVGRTPLDEWSARCRDLYLTTHNTHNRQTSMPPMGFEPTISAGEQLQTYALDRAATGTGNHDP